MKTYAIETTSILKLYISMLVSAIISFLLPYVILPFFVEDKEVISGYFIVIFVVLFFVGIKISKKYVNSTIAIKLSDEEIILKNEKVHNFKLKDIQTYHIKYTHTNFPWFKIVTHQNKQFKFNCKDKGDEVFNDFAHHFVEIMENYNAAHKIK